MKELRANNTTGLRRVFAFVTALAAVVAGGGTGLAQGPVTNLMILNVDSSNAPDYTLRVSALTPDGAGIADLAQDQFSITAGDGAPIPISSAQPYNAGVAVIIVADLGGLDQKSPRGATYQAEVESVARQLVQSLQKNSPNQEDFAGVVAVTGASDVRDVKFGLLLTPTNDLGLAANSLEPIKSMKVGPTTALFDGLNKALDMLAVPELEHMRKVIVAFSDGADQKFSGDAILGNIPVRAREGKVIIYSLQAHMRSDVEAKNMNVLAVQSGGKYALIDAKPEAISTQLEQIFSLINSQAVQYVLNFRSVRSQGDYSARLSVNTPAGNFGQDFHFTSNVIPPTVQLVEPSTGKSYSQAGVKPVEPITLTASVTFPNGKERPVTVEFRADDKHIGDANQAPYQFVWKPAAETLADAAQTITHSLNAVLKDSWLPNTTAESNRIEVSFKIAIRPTPTPAPIGTVIQKTTQDNYVLVAALAVLGVALLGVATLLALNNRRTRAQMQQLQAAIRQSGGVAKAVVSMTRRLTGGGGGAPKPVIAELEVVQGAMRGQMLCIDSETCWIGRDPARCQIVIADDSISGQHCQVIRDPTGRFFLLDEKSTNGTFVNQNLVPKQQRIPLQAGTMIQLGNTSLVLRLSRETRHLAQPTQKVGP